MAEVNPALKAGRGNLDPFDVDHVDTCHTLIPSCNSPEVERKVENEIDLMIQLSGMTGITTQSND